MKYNTSDQELENTLLESVENEKIAFQNAYEIMLAQGLSTDRLKDLAQSKGVELFEPYGPIPLPDSLPAVLPFSIEMLPEPIRGFLIDFSERTHSPIDFLAVSAITGISAVVGNKIRICPKENDDWEVFANQWCVLIGRPSAMKSPSIKAALEVLHEIEEQFAKKYTEEMADYEVSLVLADLEKKNNISVAKEKISKNDRNGALQCLQNNNLGVSRPIRQRIVVNDSTVEKLGELLNENPNGLLLERDELNGFLSKLAKEEYQSERAFYLESFDGNKSFSFHRISRGTVEIEKCTLSIAGGLQPSILQRIVKNSVSGKFDDGLLQRFQLAVFPDILEYKGMVDRTPDIQAIEKYKTVFHDLIDLDTAKMRESLHFSPEAQHLFNDWMHKLLQYTNSGDLHPALESHLLKMLKTIPGLALLFELIAGGRECVNVRATEMALKWADYLQSHANRIYSLGLNTSVAGARLILARRKKLPEAFKANDIRRKGWVGLSSVEDINDALQCLIDHRYLIAQPTETKDVGGRPTIVYTWLDYDEE